MVRQVAHPEQMSRLPRRYFASFRGSGFVAGGAPDHRSYLRHPVLNPGAPERFAPCIELPVYVGDPSCGAEAALYTLLGMPCNCEAELNGHAVTLSMNVEGFVMAKIPPEWVRAGENIVRITAPPENVLLDLFIELSGAE